MSTPPGLQSRGVVSRQDLVTAHNTSYLSVIQSPSRPRTPRASNAAPSGQLHPQFPIQEACPRASIGTLLHLSAHPTFQPRPAHPATSQTGRQISPHPCGPFLQPHCHLLTRSVEAHYSCPPPSAFLGEFPAHTFASSLDPAHSSLPPVTPLLVQHPVHTIPTTLGQAQKCRPPEPPPSSILPALFPPAWRITQLSPCCAVTPTSALSPHRYFTPSSTTPC